ncbi:MAG: hypothetical protein H0U45_13605 [Tatlockia sp.]|jgi:hypothetical protein|nr:hypothetical protein [Tatlockia sp.]
MKVIERSKQITFSLAMVGSTSALLLSALTLGLGIGWHITFKDFKLSGLGPNIFQDMAGRYFLISIFLLLLIALLQMRNNIFIKISGLIPLAFIILQCRVLIKSKPTKLPDWVTEYSNWLEIILYIDFYFLALGVVLLILQLYLIRLDYRSSVYDSPHQQSSAR